MGIKSGFGSLAAGLDGSIVGYVYWAGVEVILGFSRWIDLRSR